MRKLYALVLYLATPLVLSFLAWRGLKDRGYARRWGERFGRYRGPAPAPGGLILHAASVGEANAAAALIRSLSQHLPELPLTVTTFTPTGSRRVKSLFGRRVHHVFAPLDLPGAVKRFFRRFEPRLLVVLETEIWPNLYAEAQRAGVPILLINARLTERSAQGYRRARQLIADALRGVAWVSAQSARDAERLVACGARPERVEVVGNLKFDVSVPPTLPAEGRMLRSAWGEGRPVLVAGSTHAGDEAVLLPAFLAARERLADPLLILVPRHPERFGDAAKRAREAGLRVALFSESQDCPPGTDCFVIDAMGELLRYYACCDVAFVGGTFAPVGGHNPLEPAALGKPVLFGPHTENIDDIAERLVAEGGALRLESAEQLSAALVRWLSDPTQRSEAGEAARRLVEGGRGALQRNLAAIRHFLDHA